MFLQKTLDRPPQMSSAAPLGLYKEEAASCRFTNVQSPEGLRPRGVAKPGLCGHSSSSFPEQRETNRLAVEITDSKMPS